MNDDFKRKDDDPLDSILPEELEEILDSWEVGRPSVDLAARLLRSYRSKRSFFGAGVFSGSFRVPVWAAAACLLLFLVMLPLSIRGLRLSDSKPETTPGSPANLAEIRGGNQLGFMTTDDSASMENYITVADLTEFRPTKDINLKVFRTEGKKQ